MEERKERLTVEQLEEFRQNQIEYYQDVLAGKRIYDQLYPGMVMINDSFISIKLKSSQEISSIIGILKTLKFHDVEGYGVVLCNDMKQDIEIAAEFYKDAKLRSSKMFLSHK